MDTKAMDELYAATIKGAWGMRDVGGTSSTTCQGLDYLAVGGTWRAPNDTTDAQIFGDAWVVRDASLSAKSISNGGDSRFETTKHFPTTLVFAAGPNANPSSEGRAPSSSYMRADPTALANACLC